MARQLCKVLLKITLIHTRNYSHTSSHYTRFDALYKAYLTHVFMCVRMYRSVRFSSHPEPLTRAWFCTTGAAMLAVLEDDKARTKIEGAVENELTNVHSGEYAGEIRQEVPTQYREYIPEIAKSVSLPRAQYNFPH